jgi:N-ethylmaleimide reductase
MNSGEPLFNPLRLGAINAPNRLVYAPCSRHRARVDGTPTDMMVEYYRQRASAGLIIAEATAVSAMAYPYFFIPGMHADSHVAGWRKVTDAVHAAGGRIALQLFHGGRIGDTLMTPGGATPVAPSAVRPDPLARHYTVSCPRAKRSYGTPQALSTQGVRAVVQEFASAAVRSLAAGFDAVEVHAASGYLVMQFLTPNTNQRTDEYGGSIERRASFLLECVAAMQAVTRKDFVAVKISPGWTFHDVFDDAPAATYSYVAQELSRLQIAWLQVGAYGQDWDVYGTLRPLFKGPMLGVGGFTRSVAAQAISSGLLDAVAFGQAFMANPDLAERFRNGWKLNAIDADTFYTQGVEGYSDYPTHAHINGAREQLAADAVYGKRPATLLR